MRAPSLILVLVFFNFLIERAHCGFGTLGTKTLGGFSEIDFGGEIIHPSWSKGGDHTDFFIVLQGSSVFLLEQ
jgi:hypothetical protein